MGMHGSTSYEMGGGTNPMVYVQAQCRFKCCLKFIKNSNVKKSVEEIKWKIYKYTSHYGTLQFCMTLTIMHWPNVFIQISVTIASQYT